jgi:hypothetical protein
MANKKFYTIIAGSKDPKPVEFGKLNKTTGMPQGETTKAFMAVGAILVLNFSRAWGKRVLPTGVKAKNEGSIQATDPNYRGEIEFLKWGASGGELIEIRYLKNSTSLDKQYQDVVQKLKPTDEDVYVILRHGDNEFDEEREPQKARFLQVCAYNRDSVYKDPTIWDWDFFESTDEADAVTKRSDLLTRNLASNTVLEASNETLAVLATIFGEDARKLDKRLSEILVDKAEKDPKEFLAQIDRYKNNAGLKLRDAMEQQLIDVTGTKGIGYTGKDGLPKELPTEGSTGAAKLEWVIANLLSPEVFEMVSEVIAATEKHTAALAE